MRVSSSFKSTYSHAKYDAGSGYVQQVGSSVKTANVGDAVLLSFQSCATCKDCLDKHPSFCQSFAPTNYGGEQSVFQLQGGAKAAGSFFGQSSFASHTIVKESSVVNVSALVKTEEDLKLFAPLGCGFQSGMGTVNQLTGASERDSIVIMGLGGVGLAAVMVSMHRTINVHLANLEGCQITKLRENHWHRPLPR